MFRGIYIIICKENGYFYIGRTMNLVKRWHDHLRDLHLGKHKNPRLQNCFDKYGKESFDCKILYNIVDRVKQEMVEQQLLNQYMSDPKCMNINRSAATFCDVPWTEERKQKIRLAHIGRKMPPMSEEQRKKRSERMKGHTVSAAIREKIAAAHRGKPISDKHRKALRERFAGVGNPMYGRRGEFNPQSIPVLQIDMQTLKIVREYSCAAEAAKILQCDASSISKACKRYKQVKGYLWCYKQDYERHQDQLQQAAKYLLTKQFIKHGVEKPNARSVCQYTKDGKLIAEFEYVSKVAEFGFDPSTIVKVCRGKNKSAYGYIWRYKE